MARKMYGWRAVIGHVEPAIWAEWPEWQQVLPKDIGLVVTCLGVQRLVPEELERAGGEIIFGARQLSAYGVDVIAAGGSPVVTLRGYEGYLELLRSLRAAVGVPVVTSLGAAIEALQSLSIRKLAVATPYPEERNKEREGLLDEAGFQVLKIKGLGIESTAEIARLSPEVSYELGRQVLAEAPEAEGLYVSCAKFPVVGNIAPLERELGVPVVTSVQAQIWACLRAMNLKERIVGYGRLFETL